MIPCIWRAQNGRIGRGAWLPRAPGKRRGEWLMVDAHFLGWRRCPTIGCETHWDRWPARSARHWRYVTVALETCWNTIWWGSRSWLFGAPQVPGEVHTALGAAAPTVSACHGWGALVFSNGGQHTWLTFMRSAKCLPPGGKPEPHRPRLLATHGPCKAGWSKWHPHLLARHTTPWGPQGPSPQMGHGGRGAKEKYLRRWWLEVFQMWLTP